MNCCEHFFIQGYSIVSSSVSLSYNNLLSLLLIFLCRLLLMSISHDKSTAFKHLLPSVELCWRLAVTVLRWGSKMIVLPIVLMNLVVTIVVVFETWKIGRRVGRIWRLFVVVIWAMIIYVVVGVFKCQLMLEIVGFGITLIIIFIVVVIGAANWDHASVVFRCCWLA